MVTATHKNGSSFTAPVFIWLGVAVIIMAMAGFYFFNKSPAASSTSHHPNTSLPNIIFIIADDIAWNDYGFNQHPRVSTPNIDQLASEGVLFNNAYTPNSICRPSLASIITGLYPSQHGITANARAINQRRGQYDIGLPPYAKRMQGLNTLPRELAKLGYRSLQTGKWWEEGFANGGFDEGDKKPQGLFRHVTRTNVIGREGLQPIFDFIDQNKQQPFFIWYAPQMPHTPHNPPAEFLNAYLDKTTDPNLAKYLGMVSWFDHTVGQIVAHLQTQGLRENTLIVYMADNGVSLHSDLENAGFGDGKDSPYEMGNRTPIIFNWPGHWQAAQHDALISNIDIFPTLMELLKVTPDNLPGISVLPTISEGKQPQREFVVGEGYADPGKEVFDSPRKFRWIRSGKWKLVAYTDDRIELFDLTADADEQHNLSAESSLLITKNELLQKLDQTLPR
jgi:arylsulfatase A-like enzyme